MSWEQIAGGAVAAAGGIVLVVRDYRKSKVVDDSAASSGLASLVENLQEDNREVRARLDTCEKRYDELRELVIEMRRRGDNAPPSS